MRDMENDGLIRTAFGQDASLCDRVLAAAKQNRDQIQLFLDIARYTITRDQGGVNAAHPEPSGSKKRKLDAPETSIQPRVADTEVASNQMVLYAPDTSFALPVRKKLNLRLTAPLDQRSAGHAGLDISANGDAVLGFHVSLALIDQVFCLPVPEKAQRQQNFVVFTNGPADCEMAPPGDHQYDQFVWTMPETAPKAIEVGTGSGLEVGDEDTYVSATKRCLDAALQGVGKRVIVPDEKEFASAIPQSHRKGEKAYHVKAHIGSKEGYLFFLSCGIVWGFKKPMSFYPFDLVESISYTSVLQRTFNFVLTALPAVEGNDKRDVEFAMIDQADFAGIDDYIKRHGLNDASMSAERQAKKLNINGARRGEPETNGHVDVGAEEEESELQKAQRELEAQEDEEDEEEEDYDPGSEGDSEGEGSNSDEDEDADADADANDEDGDEDEDEEME